MARAKPSPLERQLTKATRRLFLHTLLSCLFWGWFLTLLISAGWFLAQSQITGPMTPSMRLMVAGGLIGVATLVGLILALLRAPAKVAAALLMDERFGLKERVTTSLMLTPELKSTAAAQALLADVNDRVSKIDVGSRFPLRVSWITGLAPAVAAIVGAGGLLLPAAVEPGHHPRNRGEGSRAPERCRDRTKAESIEETPGRKAACRTRHVRRVEAHRRGAGPDRQPSARHEGAAQGAHQGNDLARRAAQSP